MLRGIEKSAGLGFIDRFVNQSVGHGDRIAIACDQQIITYAHLHRLMLVYAEMFVANGLFGGAVVLYLPRGIELITAMLASQYCRVPYVPVDLSTSKDSLEKILDNPRYVLLFDSRSERLHVGAMKGVRAFDVSTLSTLSNRSRTDGAMVTYDEGSVADNTETYRIYTSGSTGAPKAVMVSESGCRNILDYFCDLLAAGEKTSWLSSTSVAFDIFYLEYVVPLAVGGKVILLTDKQASSPQEVARLLSIHRPTVYQGTPSVLKCVLPYLDSRFSFDKLLVGGEELSSRLSGELFGRSSWLCNVYGPTETTIWSTYNIIDAAGEKRIGEPIQNTQIYILDDEHKRVQRGKSGKIFIAGAGVAQGYYNNEQLTSAKFIEMDINGIRTRVYDTGDIGFIDEQGSLNYERREGDFYKVNGNRVDLAEIVDALENIESISEAAVSVVSISESLGNLLVGFIRKRPAADSLDVLAIRQYLKNRLPSYMQPHYIFEVEGFKYTTNGKLDRHELDRIAVSMVDSAINNNGHYRDTLLSTLAKYVNIEGLGDNDNIFDRGLTSMQAVSLHLDLAQYCPEMELHHLFDEPTLSGFRAHLAITN